MEVGFIGLGIMGSRMAANLLKAGFSLAVYNRTKASADELLSKGARWAASPQALAQRADVLVTMLSKPEVVEAAALGENGFLKAMKPGAVWMDSTTVNPSFSRRMAAEAHNAGVRFVDAPVAGSKAPAENAQLTFLVGGAAADVETCRPLMNAMGQKIIHAGDTGAGAALKMVFNLLLGQSMLAFAEALRLGEGLGLTRASIFDALTGAVVVAPSSIAKRKKIETEEYSPEFPLQWMQKDLQLAAQSAYELGISLPATNVAKEVYMLAIQHGYAEKDLSAIFQFLNEDSGKKNRE